MPQYRLQTLLEIRERAEEEAKQAFSEAMKAVQKEKDAQKKLEDDLIAARNRTASEAKPVGRPD